MKERREGKKKGREMECEAAAGSAWKTCRKRRGVMRVVGMQTCCMHAQTVTTTGEANYQVPVLQQVAGIAATSWAKFGDVYAV